MLEHKKYLPIWPPSPTIFFPKNSHFRKKYFETIRGEGRDQLKYEREVTSHLWDLCAGEQTGKAHFPPRPPSLHLPWVRGHLGFHP